MYTVQLNGARIKTRTLLSAFDRYHLFPLWHLNMQSLPKLSTANHKWIITMLKRDIRFKPFRAGGNSCALYENKQFTTIKPVDSPIKALFRYVNWDFWPVWSCIFKREMFVFQFHDTFTNEVENNMKCVIHSVGRMVKTIFLWKLCESCTLELFRFT